MAKLTAAMIVRNEEGTLPSCLESLVGVADELVVVDTGSTDSTPVQMIREEGADRFASVRFLRRPFVDFGDARRASTSAATGDWILWIDADERLTPALAEELRRRLDDGSLDAHDAWRLPFETVVLGRVMRSRELAGQRHLRLFRRGTARIEGVVHESVVPAEGATVGDLDGMVRHVTMHSWRTYLGKARRYAALEARGRPGGVALLHLPFALPATFLRQYLRRGCWRDGWAGLVWAFTSGLGSTLRDVYALARP